MTGQVPEGTVPEHPDTDAETVLDIRGLRTHFLTDDSVIRAVDGVDLSVHRGRTLCVVGESGCGKSAMARSVLQLVDPPGQVDRVSSVVGP